MKLKKLWLGLVIILGTLVIGEQQVDAEVVCSDPGDVFLSGYQPIKIYADPETTHPTGATLSTDFNKWRVVRYYLKDNHIYAEDLGHNQWVKFSDIRVIFPPYTFYVYVDSANKAVPIYDDAVFTKQIATLDPKIRTWKINRVATPSYTGMDLAYDLGDNQWVKASDVIAIRSMGFFQTGTALYTADGVQVGSLQASLSYSIFESKMIHGNIYVRLGTDEQWALYRTLA